MPHYLPQLVRGTALAVNMAALRTTAVDHAADERHEAALAAYRAALRLLNLGPSRALPALPPALTTSSGSSSKKTTEGTGDGLLVSLLLNSAACHLAPPDATPVALERAASLARTALALDPSSVKAHFRAALALDRQGHAAAAGWFMERAADLSGAAPVERESSFLSKLGSQVSAATGAPPLPSAQQQRAAYEALLDMAAAGDAAESADGMGGNANADPDKAAATDEQWEQANDAKEEGNNAFRARRSAQALVCYSRGVGELRRVAGSLLARAAWCRAALLTVPVNARAAAGALALPNDITRELERTAALHLAPLDARIQQVRQDGVEVVFRMSIEPCDGLHCRRVLVPA